MARLRTPHVVALAVAGALLLGVRPAGGEGAAAAAGASARSAPGGRLRSRSCCPSHPVLHRCPRPAVYHGLMLLLGNSCGWAWTAVRTVPLPLHPLRAAMLNVTADYDQARWVGQRVDGACKCQLGCAAGKQ